MFILSCGGSFKCKESSSDKDRIPPPACHFFLSPLFLDVILFKPRLETTCFMPYANNKGADQPAHLRSLISAFVVSCLDSIIPLVSISEIASLKIVSVAEQAGLRLPGRKP